MTPRQILATLMALATPVSWAQQSVLAPRKPGVPAIVRPYFAVEVPPPRLANNVPLQSLIRGGVLYLSRQDAIAIALDNDIDLEIARYNPIIAAWQVERAEAGGLLPGVPSNASQAGAVAIGQGVAGSQAAAGTRVPGLRAAVNQTANASISQIGPVTQTLDPIFQESSTFSHTTTPQPNIVQSITPVLISDTRAHAASIQQGLLTGGLVQLHFTDNYLKENSPTDVLNPSNAPNLSLSFQHALLRGFGIAVNARTINVAKLNANTSELSFKTQVIGLVTQVLNLYDGLSADYADLKAKQDAASVAHTFVGNVQKLIQLGASAQSDLISAQQQMVTGDQAVVDSEAALENQQDQLKALLSRGGTTELANVKIVPVDPIPAPAAEPLPSPDELVREALANRSDLAATQQNLQAAGISALGTHNGLLPNLQVFGSERTAGLAGTAHTVTTGKFQQTPDPYFVGGLGTALGQVFRRNFPSQSIGAFFAASLRNWQAQADYAIDQLQLRQSQLAAGKNRSQVEVDVRNALTAIQQAGARYQSAMQNRILQQALLKAEQEKFGLGTSTPYNVIQQQRDVVAAESAETAAMLSYSNARTALDQTTGRTLEVNHVSIAQARQAAVPVH